MKIVTVIQARLGSSRLPGKVLAPVLDRPLLELMLERVRSARLVGSVVVAIPTGKADRPLAELCKMLNVNCFAGDEDDLLDRHYQAGKLHCADAVVKIPSDCPLVDPRVIDKVLGFYLSNPDNWDFVSNLHPPSWPDGNDVEVMSMAALKQAWREAERPLEREHTTPFFWENPDRFRVGNVRWDRGIDLSGTHRWTLDYAEDLQLISTVFERLYPRNPRFGLDDVLQLLEADPELARLNERFNGVNWYRHHLDELRTVSADQTRLLEGEAN